MTLSTGYAYTRTQRSASRFQFQYFRPEGALIVEIAQERPDFLLSDFNVFNYGIELRDVSGAEGTAAYDADLMVHAGYGQAEIQPVDAVRAQFGVRFEDAVQTVQPIGGTLLPTRLANRYWLPAATVTWTVMQDLQVRLHASRTIARPQFRELAPQIYQDFESDREFTGNPFLTDSELTNAEARIEYYFRPDQRVTLAGFYKNIDNPIEAAAFFAGGGQLRTGFANAPQAELYGAEIELQTFLPLEGLGGRFFATRRLVLIGNYTYTQSNVAADDSIIVGPDLQPVAANLLFEDGAPLTGQSDHLANLQLGIEDTDSLSQMTVLLTYASERVTNRGPIQGLARQPDIIERPGLRLDFVARQEARLLGTRVEFSFEARNLLGEDYQEFQEIEGNRIDINSYRLGRTFSLGVKVGSGGGAHSLPAVRGGGPFPTSGGGGERGPLRLSPKGRGFSVYSNTLPRRWARSRASWAAAAASSAIARRRMRSALPRAPGASRAAAFSAASASFNSPSRSCNSLSASTKRSRRGAFGRFA